MIQDPAHAVLRRTGGYRSEALPLRVRVQGNPDSTLRTLLSISLANRRLARDPIGTSHPPGSPRRPVRLPAKRQGRSERRLARSLRRRVGSGKRRGRSPKRLDSSARRRAGSEKRLARSLKRRAGSERRRSRSERQLGVFFPDRARRWSEMPLQFPARPRRFAHSPPNAAFCPCQRRSTPEQKQITTSDIVKSHG